VGGALNSATDWVWYSGSCGGTYVGTGTTINVTLTETTTYYVRAEGACATPTTCVSFEVTVEDNSNPTISCPANVAVDNDAGNCTAIVNGIAPSGISDNCGTPTVTYVLSGATTGSGSDDASGTAFSSGITTVEYTADDGNGNTATCSFTVTVTDTEDPVAITQNITVELDAGGNATITADDVNNNSTDNCAITTTDIDISSFDCTNLGANTVTLTVTDDEGNFDTETATVTVEDNLAPIFNTYSDITVCADAGETTAVVNYADPTASDNCTSSPTVSLISGSTSGSAFPVGSNTVTYQATDDEGNSSQFSFNIIVEEVSTEPSSTSSPESPLCIDSETEITLTYSGGTLGVGATARWYSDAALTNEVGTGNNVTVIAPTENTTYYVVFDGICNTTNAVALDIVVNPLPEINAGEDIEMISGETVQLEATSNSSYTYVWTPEDNLDDATIYNPEFTPTEVGEFTLTVTVTDENSCENSDEVLITVEPGIIKIYTGFTPNDDGHNDTWVIENIETFANSKVRVFDRNNALVFETQGYQNDWRGTYDEGDGKTLLPGTYFYIIDLGDGSSAYKGTVTILSKR